MGHLEAGIISMAGIGRGMDVVKAWQLGLTGIEAKRIHNLFFGIAATSLELTAKEASIHKKLRSEPNRAQLKSRADAPFGESACFSAVSKPYQNSI